MTARPITEREAAAARRRLPLEQALLDSLSASQARPEVVEPQRILVMRLRRWAVAA